jgi:hypothetical protein
MQSAEETTQYETINLEDIRPGDSVHGEIVYNDDPGRCSILVNGKLLTVEAFQRLLNMHEGFHIQLTITDPADSPSLRRPTHLITPRAEECHAARQVLRPLRRYRASGSPTR